MQCRWADDFATERVHESLRIIPAQDRHQAMVWLEPLRNVQDDSTCAACTLALLPSLVVHEADGKLPDQE